MKVVNDILLSTVNQDEYLSKFELTVRHDLFDLEPHRHQKPRGLIWFAPKFMPVGFSFTSLYCQTLCCLRETSNVQRTDDSDKRESVAVCVNNYAIELAVKATLDTCGEPGSNSICDGLGGRIHPLLGDFHSGSMGLKVNSKSSALLKGFFLNPSLRMLELCSSRELQCT